MDGKISRNKMDGKISRISNELYERLRDYQRTQTLIQKKSISLVAASRQFARVAVAKDDNLSEALSRMGKNWKFKV